MGRHLQEARRYIGRDAGRLLDGGRYALVHTRSMEFDELRPYVRGDDVRDIDWKASARSGHPLIKQFVSEKHHKILVVADAGRNATALAPSGERKCEIATHVIGAIGLMTLPRSDEIGMVTGDRRVCLDIRLRRGDNHIESMLHHYLHHAAGVPDVSDICSQLTWVATHYRHRLLVFVIADEPDASDRLRTVLAPLTARHDVLWMMIADMPTVNPGFGQGCGYEVSDGRLLLPAALLGPAVADAYRRSEQQRRRSLSDFLTQQHIPHARVAASSDINAALTELTGRYARAR
jgi:uncharacterized protein (DUF58 family)